MRHLSAFALLATVAACSSSSSPDSTPPTPAPVSDAAAPPNVAPTTIEASLESYLIGRFDSKAQAARDKTYFAIQLKICRVAADAIGPHVLYVEQARMDTLEQPYRQRLYVVEREGTEAEQRVRSRVFELEAPDAAIGLCDRPSTARFTPASVVERPGCAVALAWDGKEFKGQTTSKECLSTLEGATYATSEVTIAEDRFVSWDRGFAADGKQVWGAVKGPYQFDRRTAREVAE